MSQYETNSAFWAKLAWFWYFLVSSVRWGGCTAHRAPKPKGRGGYRIYQFKPIWQGKLVWQQARTTYAPTPLGGGGAESGGRPDREAGRIATGGKRTAVVRNTAETVHDIPVAQPTNYSLKHIPPVMTSPNMAHISSGGSRQLPQRAR